MGRPRKPQLPASWRQYQQRWNMRRLLPAFILLGGAFVGLGIGASSVFLESSDVASSGGSLSGSRALVQCYAVDGDTLRCGSARVRLLGIDAPELPGHCQLGRACAPGDPFASTRALQRAIADGVRIERVGQDRYGRTLALVANARGDDLSCEQLRGRLAIYVQRWDNSGQVAARCADVAR